MERDIFDIEDKLTTKCLQCREDCFAYKEGNCDCLCNTDFGDKACPFYKTKEQYEDSRKKSEERQRQKRSYLI